MDQRRLTRHGAAFAFAVALAVRLAVVAWARGRFPPVEDGRYYDLLARRLAAGNGYTWEWPDGVVTYAAHYPVGYPALLAIVYALVGPSPGAAMLLNAVLGAIAAPAGHSLLDGPGAPRWRPFAGALAIALHPALVPYTAALMTEGVTAALLLAAAACGARARSSHRSGGWVAGCGVILGMATLVRPQVLVLAPVFGFLATAGLTSWRPRLVRAIAVTALALGCIAPWTVRNCVRMHRCALVSVNGGWNLLIGATSESGAWHPVAVPAACSKVWDEGAKDACFRRAAWSEIARDPGAWLGRAPRKLAMTFDSFGAAPWYLNPSNPTAFDDRAKVALNAFETLVSRLYLLGALVVCGRGTGRLATLRKLVALGGAAAALTVAGWLGYAALGIVILSCGGRSLVRAPMILPIAAAIIVSTMFVHATFFGAGRYGLVVAPFVAALAFARLKPFAQAGCSGEWADVAL